MSLSDAFNLLFIYRVYSHEELFKSILRVVDEKILNEYDSNLDNYMRGLSITLNRTHLLLSRTLQLQLGSHLQIPQHHPLPC